MQIEDPVSWEAACWAAELMGEEQLSPALRVQLKRWLRQSPQHRDELNEMLAVLEILDDALSILSDDEILE